MKLALVFVFLFGGPVGLGQGLFRAEDGPEGRAVRAALAEFGLGVEFAISPRIATSSTAAANRVRK